MTKYILPTLLIICAYSCKKENLPSDENANLHFSNDTIIFDTIFSSIGSVTKKLMVYNNNNYEAIWIYVFITSLVVYKLW